MFQWQVSQDRKKKEGGDRNSIFTSILNPRKEVNLGEENDADVQRYEETGRL